MKWPWKKDKNKGDANWMDRLSGPVDMGRGSHVRANGFRGQNLMERYEEERRRQAEEAASRRSEWEEYGRGKREEAKRIHDEMVASHLPVIEDVRDITDPDRSKERARRAEEFARIMDSDDPEFRTQSIRPHLREDRGGMTFFQRIADNLNDTLDRVSEEPRPQRMPWGGDPTVAASSKDFRVRVQSYTKSDGTQVKGYERSRPGQGGGRR